MLPKINQNKKVFVPRSTATKRETLRRPEIKRKMKKTITQKVNNILMINKPPSSLVGPKSKRRSTRTFRLSGWKQKDFGGLPWKESGTEVHVFVAVFLSVLDFEGPLREFVFNCSWREVHWQRSLHDCNSFWTSFAPSEGPTVDATCNCWAKIRKSIWRKYFPGKRAELFNRG